MRNKFKTIRVPAAIKESFADLIINFYFDDYHQSIKFWFSLNKKYPAQDELMVSNFVSYGLLETISTGKKRVKRAQIQKKPCKWENYEEQLYLFRITPRGRKAILEKIKMKIQELNDGSKKS